MKEPTESQEVPTQQPSESQETVTVQDYVYAQKFTLGDFPERLEKQNVVLKSIAVDRSVISGTIQVRSMEGDKEVAVVWTDDEWSSKNTNNAKVDPSQADEFTFCLPPVTGKNIKLAVCYSVGGNEYWDNNSSANYAFEAAC